ncbi:MAG: response regulator transcription factor [Terrimonas ferruginea]|jgi:two-component system invasion response regulator UvrY|uniref:response regulator n=1 Tax=Terrimonas ferruginea TaxID=249 RepID=UPI0003FE6836|nr:response regulator transcription factor [Terrimonas ferruginea]MBN8782417.1 response regulator transcription factor [Terrimonas ferruginea]OJW42930.1 MAG: DNA-binding response regulator [Sphingobacteriales bacterium 48-107]
MKEKIKVALADDHILLRNGLAGLVKSFDDYTVLFEADNGQHLTEQIADKGVPDLVLLDINMPLKDGFETARWLRDNHPEVRVMALSMLDNEQSIIRMLRQGAKGYILKDTHPREFKTALDTVMQKGFYYSEMVTGKLINAVNNLDTAADEVTTLVKLTEKEIEFLKLACTEMTYKEIADKMNLSPRTIDGYRDALFEKLKVRTRVGLVMYAIKNDIVRP